MDFDFIKKKSDIARNARLKTYPDGSAELLICDRPIFGMDGWEDVREHEKVKRARGKACAPERAQRRARSQLRDYALCTKFDYFVTLTLDKSKIDRYSIDVIIKRLRVWLDNRVRRAGLVYVLVPEKHKDGAIHFHGFFNSALDVTESGHYDKAGHIIYNIPAWGFGFSTAIKLYGDYNKAVSYVCKYIGKSSEKIGGRWYYSGGALRSPEVEYLNADFAEYYADGATRFSVKEAGLSFVLLKKVKDE